MSNPSALQSRPSRIVHVLLFGCVALSTIVTQEGFAAPRADKPKWHDHAYGLSLHPPSGNTVIENTADGARAKFVDQDGDSISVFIQQTDQPIDLRMIMDSAKSALTVHMIEELPEQHFRQDGRDGLMKYFHIEDKNSGNWVLGQAVVEFGAMSFILFQFDCSIDRFDRKRPEFKAVIDSLELQDATELERIRKNQLTAGEVWHDQIDRERIKLLMGHEQWFRVVQQKTDVGWMRLRIIENNQIDKKAEPGINVHIRSRIFVGDQVLDNQSIFFESYDQTTEYWDITTTKRPAQPELKHTEFEVPLEMTWRHTGLRSDNAIEIKIENPGSIDSLHYNRPPEGYLSQVEIQLLPSMLSRADQATMGFYAYYPNGGKIAYRTFRVELLDNGGYSIVTRPSPDASQQAWQFDSQGRIRRKQMADGRTFVATTPSELRAVWDIP